MSRRPVSARISRHIRRYRSILGYHWYRGRHRLAHKLGYNYGTFETWWDCGFLWVGFRCSGCGLLFHVEPVAPQQVYPEHLQEGPFPE